ncbi:hypothetical protein HF1_10360 [Mycoplasma haemofelis str. Langford 1]|uniref:Uncharacterized protein n=1 Tax=Mycoplasma haemofelis (strain Langford 1) TaxID=941640 RepID=E8ZIS3_MYCHL|nr:hypothetical protein [Mycoplasma haemofelis]CBY93044.1 hypothetical protein HF1_10360 [Mycoplasma haemofelis str. Langford 1]
MYPATFMISSLFKLIALGGSVVIGGGTLASQVLFSGATKEEFKSEELVTKSYSGSPCTIYEGEKWEGYRWFKKIKGKLGSKEEFFERLDREFSSLWNLETLKREIEGGCRSKGRVYLWWGSAQNKGNTWIFSRDLNGWNWLRERKIDVPRDLRE